MTDNRSTTPYDSENVPQSCCDCCGKRAKLYFSVSFGIDTWACESCRGLRPACVTDAPTLGGRNSVSRFIAECDYQDLAREKAKDDADSRDEEDVV